MEMNSSTEGKDHTSRLVMQEVENIRRCTLQLESVIQEKQLEYPVSTAVFKELRDYVARASLLLEMGGANIEGGWGCRTSIGLPSSVDQMNDASIRKRKLPQPRDSRRGGCRRRSQDSQHAAGIRRVECKNLEHGHSWRKYGQKYILSTKFPRSYFRCRHKYTQGCKAQKQAQKSESETSTFMVTYIGEHTCRDPAAVHIPPPMSPPKSEGSYLISFGANTSSYSDGIQITVPSPKMEHGDDQLSNLTTGSLSSNYHIMQESATPAGITPVVAAASPADASFVFPSPSTICVPMEFLTGVHDFEFDDLKNLHIYDNSCLQRSIYM